MLLAIPSPGSTCALKTRAQVIDALSTGPLVRKSYFSSADGKGSLPRLCLGKRLATRDTRDSLGLICRAGKRAEQTNDKLLMDCGSRAQFSFETAMYVLPVLSGPRQTYAK